MSKLGFYSSSLLKSYLDEAVRYSFLAARNNFRSKELQPNNQEAFWTHSGRAESLSYHRDRLWRGETRSYIIAQLALNRAKLIADKQLTSADTSGALLLFLVDESMNDGIAEVESGGFFDSNNVPPWDLWVAYVESSEFSKDNNFSPGILISWIPEVAMKRVDKAIKANAEQCILWAGSSTAPNLPQIKFLQEVISS